MGNTIYLTSINKYQAVHTLKPILYLYGTVFQCSHLNDIIQWYVLILLAYNQHTYELMPTVLDQTIYYLFYTITNDMHFQVETGWFGPMHCGTERRA